MDHEHFCECDTPLLEKAAGGAWCRSSMRSGPSSLICLLGAQRYKRFGKEAFVN